MCTAITLPLPDGRRLFGRTLDWYAHFDEQVIRIERGFPFALGRLFDRRSATSDFPYENRYAFLGTATVQDAVGGPKGYPLFADACNERGLCMAGLRFHPGAHYADPATAAGDGRTAIGPWELIPYVLGTAATIAEARAALARVRVADIPFRATVGPIPNAPMHWYIASSVTGEVGLVLEITEAGMVLYDAPTGVMTNAPDYPSQTAAWEAFTKDRTAVPGDYSSTARFVRAAHLRGEMAEALQTVPPEDEAASEEALPPSVSHFLSLIAAVSPPLGAWKGAEGYQSTLYTACMDGARGTYYLMTRGDSRIRVFRL